MILNKALLKPMKINTFSQNTNKTNGKSKIFGEAHRRSVSGASPGRLREVVFSVVRGVVRKRVTR